MINILARPAETRGTYRIEMKLGANQYVPLGLTVKARTGAEAEQKLAFCFRRELKGKTLNFEIKDFENEQVEDKSHT